MRAMIAVLTSVNRSFRPRSNMRVVVGLVLILCAMVAVFSTIFHFIMESEGRSYSWATGIYWTFTTMSTLGFGDITFHSDLGKLFSVVVLVSGALFIFVLLPFAFIQFVFLPWMQHREQLRAPRKLPENTKDHIVLTGLGPVTNALIERADDAHVPYVLLVPELADALSLYDQGYKVMVGNLDDPVTYDNARIHNAVLVAATQADTTNTNIAFTVREINKSVPIVATANSHAAGEVLRVAGCDEVLRLGKMLGHAMSRRVLGGDHKAHVVGEFGELLVAEASPAGTPLEGHTLAELDLRGRYNVSVAGLWRRGRFTVPGPDTTIAASDIIILAGSAEQLDAYDAAFGIPFDQHDPVVVIGAGRVGRAAAGLLSDGGYPVTIIEKDPNRVSSPVKFVVGDAAELEVLQEAGLDDASAVVITTHDDDVNVYLTIYCRRLRPDIQIISRANVDRNVATLTRAGADSVLSYASIGATAIWNMLGDNDSLVLAEGLEMFRTPIPKTMVNKSLAQVKIRQHTGCNVVALIVGKNTVTNPDPLLPLPVDSDLILIGEATARAKFLDEHPVVLHH